MIILIIDNYHNNHVRSRRWFNPASALHNHGLVRMNFQEFYFYWSIVWHDALSLVDKIYFVQLDHDDMIKIILIQHLIISFYLQQEKLKVNYLAHIRNSFMELYKYCELNILIYDNRDVT